MGSQALPVMLAKRRCAHLTVVGMVFVVSPAHAHAVASMWVRIVLNGLASRLIATTVFATMASASVLMDIEASFVKKRCAPTIAVPMVLAQPTVVCATLDSVDLTAPFALAHRSVAMALATRPLDCAVAERATLARLVPSRPARKTAMGVALVWTALVSVRSWFHLARPVSTSSAPTTARAMACARMASVIAMKASKAKTVRRKYAP